MTKRILKDIVIMEISAVDKPAQPGATATIMKRAPIADKKIIGKNHFLTTVHDDHQHSISTTDYDGREVTGGMTSYVENEDGEGMHSHPWIIRPDGTLEIGMALGHKHEIDSVSKSHEPNGDKSMKLKKNLLASAALVAGLIAKFEADEVGSDWGDAEHIMVRKAAIEHDVVGILPEEGPLAVQKADFPPDDEDEEAKKKREKAEKEAVNKRLARAEQIASLSAVEKGHFDTLDDDGKSEFLGLEKSDRSTAISKANEADPVIATIEGMDIRKSADPILVAMAKKMNALEKKSQIEKAATRDAKIEKRADDLDKLPGKTDVKKALIGAVLDIEDEDIQKQAFEILKAANDRDDGDFSSVGAISKADADDAEGELEKMAKSINAKNPEMTEQQAYNKALATDKGRKLYTKMKSFEADEED